LAVNPLRVNRHLQVLHRAWWIVGRMDRMGWWDGARSPQAPQVYPVGMLAG